MGMGPVTSRPTGGGTMFGGIYIGPGAGVVGDLARQANARIADDQRRLEMLSPNESELKMAARRAAARRRRGRSSTILGGSRDMPGNTGYSTLLGGPPEALG